MRKLKLIKEVKMMAMVLLFSCFSISLYAQTITIQGKIVDETGQPLVGATVRVPGTTTAATADVSGGFTLGIPANTKSVSITFIGYVTVEKPIPTGAKNLGVIALVPDSKVLNQISVVDIGYGQIKKSDVTGTVATVDAKTLQEIPASNVFEQLKGRVAGLDVVQGSNGPQITIRGNRTIGAVGGDQPLVVLDGQPYFNSIENIDPNDIKDVQILKGASATSIYGSRGSGGVILITTNRGRVGQTVTSYDSYVGQSRVEGTIKVLDGPGFAQLAADALQGAMLQNNATVNPYALTTTEAQALAGGISTNYVDMLLKPAYIWDQSLRVSGGTDKSQFTVGVGYRTTTGVEPNNDTKRMSLNATLDHRINKYLKFGLSSLTTLRLINTGGGSQLSNALYFSPLTYPYNPDGSLNLTPQIGQIDATTANPLLQGISPNQFYNKTRGISATMLFMQS